MPNQEVVNFIRQQMAVGYGEEGIKKALRTGGFSDPDIEEAAAAAGLATNQAVVIGPPAAPALSVTDAPFLPGPIALLREALSLYRRRLGVFWGVALVAVIPMLVFPFLPGHWLIVLVFSLMVFLTQLLVWPALLFVVVGSEENLGVAASLRRGFGKILSFLWLGILLALSWMGGTLLLLVPAFLFFVWFSLSFYVLAAEDIRGLTALLKSRFYVRGRWWGVLVRFLVFSLVAAFFYLSGYLLLFYLPIKVVGLTTASAFYQFWSSVANTIWIWFVITPLGYCYGFLIYRHLRAAKAGLNFQPGGGLKALVRITAILGLLGLLLLSLMPFLAALFFSNVFGTIVPSLPLFSPVAN